MPDVSVVIPARDERAGVADVIDGILAAMPCEILVVVDSPDDATLPALGRHRPCSLVSTYGPGPANAIRYGIDHATAPVVAVMMADGSDDPAVLPELVRLVQGGSVIACASRYMRGGSRPGGPLLPRTLSRLSGLSLCWLAGAGTHDASNAYKAYDAAFLKRAGIESRRGFEMGVEMVAKATRLGLPVAEVPVTWHDRTDGTSHFRLRKWLPAYLHWWWFAFGPPEAGR